MRIMTTVEDSNIRRIQSLLPDCRVFLRQVASILGICSEDIVAPAPLQWLIWEQTCPHPKTQS
jgi:hypothetical protein